MSAPCRMMARRWAVLCLYCVLLFLIATPAGVSAAGSKHGLFWGSISSSNYNTTIASNNEWQTIPEVQITLHLQPQSQSPLQQPVVISYDAVVEAHRISFAKPMPREGSVDYLQMRCLIDGIPYRPSSSVASVYGVEQLATVKLTNAFAISLSSSVNHTITIQWKKIGENIQWWSLSSQETNTSSLSTNALSLIAHADFRDVFTLSDPRDSLIAVNNVWKPLTASNLTFHLSVDSIVTIGFSVIVQPQLLKYVKNRAIEFISVRSVVDGVRYLEGSEMLGSNPWNPIGGSLRNSMRLSLSSGVHTVMLQWKKLGTAFQAWTASPSTLDGFASSKNIIVSVDRYVSPFEMSLDRQSLLSNKNSQTEQQQQQQQPGTWQTINKEPLQFLLLKESAVAIRYALPITQLSNPNSDASTYKPLASVEARLIVDGVAYTATAEDRELTGSRRLDSLFGTLSLVLPPGSHYIELQWRSDQYAWMSLPSLYSHADSILTYISSENAQPTIAAPTFLTATEDTPLSIDLISIADVDDLLIEGMELVLNVTITHGILSFPNIPILAHDIDFVYGVGYTSALFKDSISNINAALKGMVFLPEPNYFGSSQLLLHLSDFGGSNELLIPLTTDASVDIAIAAVDDRFIWRVPSVLPWLVDDNHTEFAITGMTLDDSDSFDDLFRFDATVACGSLRLNVSQSNKDLIFNHGFANESSKSLTVTGTYTAVTDIFRRDQLIYAVDRTCMTVRHDEIVTLRMTNMMNIEDSLQNIVILHLSRDREAPFLTGPKSPRWSLKGIVLEEDSHDSSTEIFSASVIPQNAEEASVFTVDAKDATFSSQGDSSPSSQLIVLDNGILTYALQVSISSLPMIVRAAIVGSNYVVKGTNMTTPISIKINVDVAHNDSSWLCSIDGSHFAAQLAFTGNGSSTFQCAISLPADNNRRTLTTSMSPMEVYWINLVSASMESAFTSLLALDPLSISSVEPQTVISHGESMIWLTVNYPQLVSYCVINGRFDQLSPAVQDNGRIVCQLPILQGNQSSVSVVVASVDLHLQSQSYSIAVSPNPILETSVLSIDLETGQLLMTATLSNLVNNSFSSSYCVVDGYQQPSAVVSAANTLVCSVEITMREALQCCASEDCISSVGFDGFESNAMNMSCSNSLLLQQDSRSILAHFHDTNEQLFPGSFVSFFVDQPSDSSLQSQSFFCLDELGVKTPAIVEGQQLVTCQLPFMYNSTSTLMHLIDLDGSLILSSLVTNITRMPEFVTLSSNHGSFSGGKLILLSIDETSGHSLMGDAEYMCLFGDKHVVATVASSASIQCKTPASSPGDVALRILMNNRILMTSFAFHFDEPVVVIDIYPKSGALIGGTNITVSGSNFLSISASVWCQFGTKLTLASVLGDDILSCLAPSYNLRGFADFHLLSAATTTYGSPLQFLYSDDPIVTGCSPKRRIAGDRSAIAVMGFNFDSIDSSDSITCSINGKANYSGTVFNSSIIYCSPNEDETLFMIDQETLMSLTIHVSSKLGRQYAVDGSTTIVLLPVPSLSAAGPGLAIANTSTSFNIYGQNLLSEVGWSCYLGNVRGEFRVMSSVTAACLVIADQRPAEQVELKVISGNDVSQGNLLPADARKVTIVSPVVVSRVYPLIGRLSGGEIITVSGDGFHHFQSLDLKQSLRCRFGSVLTPAMIHSNGSQVACLSPVSSSVGSEPFSVVVDSLSIIDKSFHFRFISEPHVLYAMNTVGSVVGGESVIIRGLGFVRDVNWLCEFNRSLVANGRVVNETTLECISPAVSSEGAVSLAVKINGFESTFRDFSYRYVVPPTVETIKPLVGSVEGSSSIDIWGSHFILMDQYYCSFGDRINVMAMFLNSSLLRCMSPIIETAGPMSLSIRLSNAQLHGASSANYLVIGNVNIQSLQPTSGSINGGTELSILSNNIIASLTALFPNEVVFDSYNTSLACLIDTQFVAASLHRDGVVTCVTPQAPVGPVRIALTWKQVPFAFAPDQYRYADDVSVTSFSPSIGSVDGTTMVYIYGWGFEIGMSQCIFGNISVVATTLSPQSIVCLAPSMEVGLVPLQVQIGGHVHGFDAQFEYRPALSIERLIERTVLTTQQTISIVGQGFESTQTLRCLFNKRIFTTATLVNDTLMQCTLPQSIVGPNVPLSILTNDITIESKSPLLLDIYSLASLRLLAPDIVPVNSFVDMTVEYSEHVSLPDSDVRCNIGSFSTEAIRSVTGFVCSVFVASSSASKLEVALDFVGIGIGLLDHSISIAPAVEVLDMWPTHGYNSRVSEIIVVGINFQSSYSTSCMLGSAHGVAVIVNETAISCTFSGDLGGDAAQSNSQLFLEMTVIIAGATFVVPYRFALRDDLSVVSIYPPKAPIQGGNAVLVSGSGLYSASSIGCWFGSEISAGHYDRKTSNVTCTVPRYVEPGMVGFSLEIDGMVSNIVDFEYQSAASIDSISPNIAFAATDTSITVTGHSFLPFIDYFCQISGSTEEMVPAVFLSERELSCLVPAANDMNSFGQFAVAYKSASDSKEVIVSNLVDFVFLEYMMISTVSVQYIDLNGDQFLVGGMNFQTMLNTSCLIGDIRVSASVLDSSTIICNVPKLPTALLQRSLPIRLDFAGLIIEHPDLSVVVSNKPQLLSIDHTQVPANQQTDLLISTNVVSDALSYCVFSSVGFSQLTLAKAVDASTVTCKTPKMADDLVMVSLETIGWSNYRNTAVSISVFQPSLVFAISQPMWDAAMSSKVDIILTGQGFASTKRESCVWGEQWSAIEAWSDNRAQCSFVVEPSLPSQQSSSVLIVDQFNNTIYVFPVHSDYSAVRNAIATYPTYAVVGSVSSFTISAPINTFRSNAEYECSLASQELMSLAFVVDSQTLKCSLPIDSKIQSSHVTLYVTEIETSARWNATVDLAQLLEIASVSIDWFNLEEGFLPVVSELANALPLATQSVAWQCIVGTTTFPAAAEDSTHVTCMVHVSQLCENVVSLSLLTADQLLKAQSSIPSNQVINCASWIAGQDSNSDRQPTTIFANTTASYQQAKLIQKLYRHRAKMGSLTTPGFHQRQSTELKYKSIDDIVWPHSIPVLIDVSSKRSLLVNSRPACLDCMLDAIVPEFPLDMIGNGKSSLFPTSSAQLPMIDSIQPLVISSWNATWVTIYGRNFGFDTECAIRNGTETVASMFLSPGVMQCLVPGLAQEVRTGIDVMLLNGDHVKTRNPYRLWYDFAWNSLSIVDPAQLTPVTFPQLPNATSSRSGSLCLSQRNNCEVNQSLNSAQDRIAFGVSNYSQWISSTDFLQPLSTSSQTEPSEVYAPVILLVEQSSIEIPCTDCFISAIGTSLNSGNPWCLQIETSRNSSKCFADVPGQHLYCAIPDSLIPGPTKLRFLSKCYDSVFESPLDINLPAKTNKVSAANKVNLTNVSLFDEMPIVRDIFPTHGFIDGDTMITVSTTKAKRITDCYFATNKESYRTPAMVSSDDSKVFCKSPLVQDGQRASFAVILDSNELVETPFVFEFKLAPTLYGSVVSSSRNSSFLVTGSGFSSFARVYCRIRYSGDFQVILNGRMHSDLLVECYGLSDISFMKLRRVLSVALTFNTVDFLPDLPISSSHSELLVDAEAFQSSTIGGDSSTETTVGSEFNSTVRSMEYWNCDRPNYKTFPLPPIVDVSYSCNLDDRLVAKAIHTSHGLICAVPVLRPKTYVLTVASDQDLHLPYELAISCVPQPKINSVTILAYDEKSRMSVFRVEGINFFSGLTIMCSLDGVNVNGVVDSISIVLCPFADVLEGQHELIVSVDGHILSTFQWCLPQYLIFHGGSLRDISREDCVSKSAVSNLSAVNNVLQLPTTEYQIRTFTPRSGLSTGLTYVTIIADRIFLRSDIICQFSRLGMVMTSPALVHDVDTVVCQSPRSMQAGNFSLSLASQDNLTHWCCGWFFVHPVVILNAVTPTVINGAVGGILTLEVTNLDLDVSVYCHVDGLLNPLPTIRINATFTTCRLPPIASETAAISIGSYAEHWSNPLPILILRQSIVMKVSPSFGSIFGGTNVSIVLPSTLVGLIHTPYCSFGDSDFTVGFVDRAGVVLCVSPSHDVSEMVDVVIREGNFSNSPVFMAGFYHYSTPAEVVNVEPRNVKRGNDCEVLLAGFAFMDGPLIGCDVFENAKQSAPVWRLPGRWLSDRLVQCTIPATVFADRDELFIGVSNNGQDQSSKRAQLTVNDKLEIVSLSPAIGFTIGNSLITIETKLPHGEEQLFCDFEGSLSVAFSLSDKSLACKTPRQSTGVVNVSLVNGQGTSFARFPFEFVDVPLVRPKWSSYAALRNLSSTVDFMVDYQSVAFDLIGRLITHQPFEIVTNNCHLADKTTLRCSEFVYNGSEEHLYLQISSNGNDYVTDVLAVPVNKPSIVLWTDPLYTIDSASGYFEMSLNALASHPSLVCQFVVDGIVEESSALSMFVDGNQIRCLYPPFALSSTVSLTVLQNRNKIFGPRYVNIVKQASIASVVPNRIAAGKPATLRLSFIDPVPKYPQLSIYFAERNWPLTFINSQQALVVVESLAPGTVDVVLLYETLNNYSRPVASIQVIDVHNDFSVNSTIAVRSLWSTTEIHSKACFLDSQYSCSINAGQCTVKLIDNCTARVAFYTNSRQSSLGFSFCSHSPCVDPTFSSSLEVLDAVTVVASKPSVGTTLGGANVVVFGTGFVSHESLQCAFGTLVSPAYVQSTSRILCKVPPSTFIGTVPLSILNHGTTVSHSLASFSFVAPLSNFSVQPKTISRLGGTVLLVTTHEQFDWRSRQYQCRFNEKFVDASIINNTTAGCVTPSFDIPVVDVAIAVEGADVSESRPLSSRSELALAYIDPVSLAPWVSTNITMLFDVADSSPLDSSSIDCLIDDIIVPHYMDEPFVICETPNLSPGQHTLVINIDQVSTVNEVLTVRNNFFIDNVFPLFAFKSQSSVFQLSSSTLGDGDADFAGCCFGNHYRSAANKLSGAAWQCFSPTITEDGFNATVTLPIGLHKTDGLCEFFGVNVSLIPQLYVSETSLTSGPTLGNSPIVLTLPTSKLDVIGRIYCRIGDAVHGGQVIDRHEILCMSRPNAPGKYPIALSVNGMDFLPTGQYFEFIAPTPQELVTGMTLSMRSSPPPILLRLSESHFPSTNQFSVIAYGMNFDNQSTCVLGDNRLLLESEWISSSELQCWLPIHTIGMTSLAVANQDLISDPLPIEFVPSPSMSTGTYQLSPLFGPRNGYTVVTLAFEHLDSFVQELYCIVGDEFMYTFNRTSSSIQCSVPPNSFLGKVPVRLSTQDGSLISGVEYFEYIDDPFVFDINPKRGTVGTELLISGLGFAKFQSLSIRLGDVDVDCAIVSNSRLLCTIPVLPTNNSLIVMLQTNGQHFVKSGISFEYFTPTDLLSLWPGNGPALKGGTLLTVKGVNFPQNMDVVCLIDMAIVPANVLSDKELQCRTPSHKPGRVRVSVLGNGVPVHPVDHALEFAYVPDVSVDKITPEFGYTSGEFPLFVFGSNFVNTSSLGCRFADMKSRGIYLSNNSLVCLTPSPIGRPELKNVKEVAVEVTVNGYDYSQSGVVFSYSEPCDQGFYCPGMTRQLCPNGTYCPKNSNNFTLCEPGYFQPMQGQINCVICPVGYICPDLGMPRPMICPPGLICDVMGLRASSKLCPAGQYCLNGTKAKSLDEFANGKSWVTDYVTGVSYFNQSTYNWSYTTWPAPAVGRSRPQHPPEPSCDGLVCAGGSTNVLAEAPFPCPIGHYCRAGAGTQIPMPKNFSSPQRCFDGFFCPRGSVSPEGSGPCPNGYFCPTQIDALVCPPGHYCPGVGNSDPVECYPGTFNPFEGQGNCTVCPTGHICPGWGLLLPEPCPAGFVCMSLGLSYPVVLCPAGYRCGEGTLTLDPSDTTTLKPYVCREGEFCLGGVSAANTVEWIPSQPFGTTHPQVCSEGTYCQAGAYLSSGSGLCFQGHYCPPNSSFPTKTPKGNFASGLGSVAPTLCYPGTYAPLVSQISCLACPSGHSCISYGTYIPTICLEGTYRSQVDSVTCSQCPTGTYSYEVGSPDLSLCLPCPKGRICGVKTMTTLASSADCPAGYICGYGTDRSSQFTHLTPAGFHTASNSVPEVQYESICQPGYYCSRGTATYMQLGGKCPVGSFCPLATPAAVSADTKCPVLTTSLGGSDELQDCRVNDVTVCDKAMIDTTKPMEDLTYYETYSYTTLDSSSTLLSFDSSTSATTPTGEIQVVQKIYPTNLTSSSPLWVNDTIEAMRTCPLYGSGNGHDKIIVVGRNFLDTRLNFCRFRACFSANLGVHPRRCKNQVRAPTGEVLDKIGNVSDVAYVTRGRFISSTRMECETPEFLFDYDFNPTFAANNYECMYITAFGKVADNSSVGNFSYVRPCDSSAVTCANLPYSGYEYFNSLTFACTTTEILASTCSHMPELNFMFNPCFSGEALVEISNDGIHYSSGDDLGGISLLSTIRYEDGNAMYNSFKNYTLNATAAVFTYVYPEYFYSNELIMDMERLYCRLPKYSEEGIRDREKGWYLLPGNNAAHVHIDLAHLPDNLVYDEHFKIAIFVMPSRCSVELCDMSRVRLSPEEFLPCRKPIDLPYWFEQTDVPKNVKTNFTVYALDDLLFKVEIHLMYGLYATYGPLFENSTTIRIAEPERAKSIMGRPLAEISTRPLTQYVSFEGRTIPMQFIFCAVVYQSDSASISQPLNLPPLYSDYQKGRALIMYNVSSESSNIPLHLDLLSTVQLGVQFWLMPATTPDESKELLDAYFETFQQTSYDAVNGYSFDLQSLVLPYLPYFSNCYEFDSYIPIWLLLEGKECALPDIYPSNWFRYNFPALPDQDDVRFVGPFDFFEYPVADWCQRTVQCNYEEDMGGQDSTPRWFETSTGTALFNLIRYPLNYFQYTGRSSIGVSRQDVGGGAYVDALTVVSGDNFISVSVDHSAGDLIAGCVYNCFARSYSLSIAYYQEDFYNKRIISASLIGSGYDFDTENTGYSLTVNYYALGFFDLIMNFAFDLSIFMVIFVVVGFLTILLGFLSWAFTRIVTLLQNPPPLRIFSMLVLIVPPPLAGIMIGVVPIWFMTSMGNYFINGYLYTDPNSPTTAIIGTMKLDGYPLQYGSLGATVTTTAMQSARAGRIGAVFFIVAGFCFYASSKMYFPREESRRELEVAKKRTKLAHKEDLWKPVLWKKANFVFSSIVLATILVCLIEISYWTLYGDYFYQVFVLVTIFGEVFAMVFDKQLNDTMQVEALNCAFAFIFNLIGFGAPDFLSFLLSNFVGFAIGIFQRVFQDYYMDFVFQGFQSAFEFVMSIGKKLLPKYLNGSAADDEAARKAKALEEAEREYRRRSVEGVGGDEEDDSESVEPILEYLAGVGSDSFILYYFPYFVYLLMQYRTEIQIPIVYGIRQSDMMIYLVYQLFLIVFQPFIDVLNHSQNELFHGWKIYEYLVYSRYRFLQRETRWKGMETTLDECIEEKLRKLDQMCFSSQYFFMLTVHVTGIIYIVLAYEIWLFWDYSPFSDSGFFLLFGLLASTFVGFEWVVMFLAIRLKVWRIKHENTAWHLQQRDEDELDVPAWEEIKGATTEAFLMNQRITSETFRYKFLNYNRTWLINQLPQILTPRTLRRSRPYLINQFARIINARRDDISEDSDDDKNKKFGPVALTTPSRNIIRFWLGRARRRLRLRSIVDPLIRRARGAQCESCLSRKQLQIEYEVDIETMSNMYDKAYPDDEKVDQVQWKQFWVNNQRYHTICLACLTKRKELDARSKMHGGVIDPSMFEDNEQEAYPDWGPVFLSAPSKAILLNWYRKAQKLRAGKKTATRRGRKERQIKDISDDEGDDPMFSWLKEGLKDITPSSKAIAIKWMRTARARLQQKRGKGKGMRESELQALEEQEALGETFKSGKKSQMMKK